MNTAAGYREFHRACCDNHELALAMLSAEPRLLDVRSGLGETALHDCAIENELHAVRLLLRLGADPDSKNTFGQSPLQECSLICGPGHDLTRVIELLLREGADPYHSTDTCPCAWHHANRSNYAPLQAVFSDVPAPSSPHPHCALPSNGVQGGSTPDAGI